MQVMNIESYALNEDGNCIDEETYSRETFLQMLEDNKDNNLKLKFKQRYVLGTDVYDIRAGTLVKEEVKILSDIFLKYERSKKLAAV
jgi:hypothetical protein